MKQPQGLISVLLDRNAQICERDDAAMDLSEYPKEKTALQALVDIASSEQEDSILLASCGESIAEIWKVLDYFDQTVVDNLSEVAREEFLSNYFVTD